MVYRVLYLDHAAEMGGAEYSLSELLRTLKSQGQVHPVVATAEAGEFAAHLEVQGIEVLPLKLPSKARYFAREQSANPLALIQQLFCWKQPFQTLINWIQTHPTDLIHSNTLKMHVMASLLSRATGVPAVWHMRDIPTHRGNALGILKGVSMVQQPRAVISISQAVQNSLKGVTGRQVTQVIHNGLDLTLLNRFPQKSKQALRRELGLPDEGALIVCVGYFIPWKSQDTLIQAFAELHHRYPKWHLVFVGKPIFQFQDEQSRLETLAKTLHVAERTHFLGEHKHILSILPAFDLFVCPSTREPFGRVILEAMASNLPIIATAAGGIPEIVSHEKEALLVPPMNPKALAEAIEYLLMQPDLAVQFSEAAFQRIQQEFTLERTCEKVLEVYKTLLPRV